MRLLVVVSNDYGELGNALYFLEGLSLPRPAVLMLPPALAKALPPRADFELQPYAAASDIKRQITAHEPDVVLLFSGYLLSVGRHVSILHTVLFLRWLRARRVPLLTSDPFLGLLGRPAELDFTSVLGGSSSLAKRLRSQLLSLRLQLIGGQLRASTHIYPAPIERLGGGQHTDRRRGYFNAATLAPRPLGSEDDEATRWIFVLSEIDCRVQRAAHGPSFTVQLAQRLREAAALGGRVMLVAPESLVAELAAVLGPHPGIVMRSGMNYPGFMAALLAAEYAFFWNLYSFSLLHRVLARRPVLFFDEGHMVQILPALREAGIRLFYDGWTPPRLALDQPLEAARLGREARQATQHFSRLADGMRGCADPMSLLREALSADKPHVLNP